MAVVEESQGSIDTTLPGSDGDPVGDDRVDTQRIGRYIVLDRIGHGAMGVVYAAYDSVLDRKVAVKLLHSDQSIHGRLQREAQAMAKVSHPNVAHVYEVGVHGEQLYLSMEFIDGQPLSEWLAAGERSHAEILEVFQAAGWGLAAAHQAGLVHRDFKPDNVLVDSQGRPRVLDFGLARAARELEESEPAGSEVARNVLESAPDGPTLSGAILGTPGFMAAEQFAGKPATALSDQFSFCVALWRALCGMRPYRGDGPMALAFAVQTGRLEPMPASAGVSKPLRRALERGLSKEARDRWPSMEALLQEIDRAQTRGRRWVVAGVGAALLGASTAAVVGLVDRRDPCASATTSMDEFWTGKQRRELRRALESAAPGYGQEVAGTVDRALHEYATGWKGLADRVCAATHEEESQSEFALELQYECLGRRFSAFETIVGELSQADDVMLSRAVEAVSGLPAVEACSDTSALTAAFPPPDDPERLVEAKTLRAELSAAHGLFRLGQIERSKSHLDKLESRVKRLDYPPATAEWAFGHAEIIEHTEGTDQARPAMLEAFRAAVDARDRNLAWKSARHLAEIIGYRQGRSEAGLQWLAVARSYLPATPREQDIATARIEVSAGSIHFRQTNYERAKKHKLTALALFEKWGDSFGAAETLGDIAVFEVSLGNLAEGRELLVRSRDAKIEVLGPRHPLVGIATQNLAATTEKQGDDDAAFELYGEAVEIAEQTRGRSHPAYSIPLVHMAGIEFRRGDLDGAKKRAENALGLLRELPGETLNLYRPVDVLIRVALAQGDLDEAHRLAEEGVEILSTAPQSHPLVAQSRVRLAQVLVERGRLDDAARELERAQAIAEEVPSQIVGGHVHLTLADVAWARGDREGARVEAETALVWYRRLDGTGRHIAAAEQWLEEREEP